MQLTIFAKKRRTGDGKTFYTYLSTLTRRDGRNDTVAVNFRDSCGKPKPEQCPMNIIVDKTACNVSTREYVRASTGELCESKTLWVSAWTVGGSYVDTSMDEYITD